MAGDDEEIVCCGLSLIVKVGENDEESERRSRPSCASLIASGSERDYRVLREGK